MTDIEKCYYLQGYIELGGFEVPDEKTWEKIKKLVNSGNSPAPSGSLTVWGTNNITGIISSNEVIKC